MSEPVVINPFRNPKPRPDVDHLHEMAISRFRWIAARVIDGQFRTSFGASGHTLDHVFKAILRLAPRDPEVQTTWRILDQHTGQIVLYTSW